MIPQFLTLAVGSVVVSFIEMEKTERGVDLGISCGNGKVQFLMVKCLWNMNIKISKWQVFYKSGVHRIMEQGNTFESSQYTIF